MLPPRTPRTMVQVEAAGQTYKQVQSFTYLRGTVTEVLDMSVEIATRTRACWMHIRRYLQEPYDQPKIALSLKTRMVTVEAIEALLYGCITWTFRQEHYAKLRTVHHRILLRIIGARRKRPDHRITSYNRALEITRCESIETTFRTRRLLWAGTLIRMSGERLPKRIVFGNLEGAVRKGRGGKEKEWTDCVQSDIRAFGIAGDWKATALKTEVWVEMVTDGGHIPNFLILALHPPRRPSSIYLHHAFSGACRCCCFLAVFALLKRCSGYMSAPSVSVPCQYRISDGEHRYFGHPWIEQELYYILYNLWL